MLFLGERWVGKISIAMAGITIVAAKGPSFKLGKMRIGVALLAGSRGATKPTGFNWLAPQIDHLVPVAGRAFQIGMGSVNRKRGCFVLRRRELGGRKTVPSMTVDAALGLLSSFGKLTRVGIPVTGLAIVGLPTRVPDFERINGLRSLPHIGMTTCTIDLIVRRLKWKSGRRVKLE
jgi:hypothetical protein